MKISNPTLLACPAFLVLILTAPNLAQAQEAIARNDTAKSVSRPPLVDLVFDRPTPKSSSSNVIETSSNDEDPTLNFTDEESQAAIQKYGCDCSGCITAVQQLQGKFPL